MRFNLRKKDLLAAAMVTRKGRRRIAKTLISRFDTTPCPAGCGKPIGVFSVGQDKKYCSKDCRKAMRKKARKYAKQKMSDVQAVRDDSRRDGKAPPSDPKQ